MTSNTSQTPSAQEPQPPQPTGEYQAIKIPHTRIEDVLALLVGTLTVSFGLSLIQQTGMLTGGTAGLAFLLHYASGISFGLAFFLLNLPFYYLAFKRMGQGFVIKTFCAVGLVSLFSELHLRFMAISNIQPLYAAVMGNILMGLGFLVLFRHRASLGGLNILALYLQDSRGIRAGKFQMVVDICILLLSLIWVSPTLTAYSVIGAIVLNLIISMNHRPHRYVA